MATNEKKSLLYYVYKTLFDYSDEEHPLTQQEIIKLINDNYNTPIERKTVANMVKTLDELGFETATVNKKGIYLLTRKFEQSEISFLVDGVFSSHIIPGKQAKDLTDKIVNELSIYQRDKFKYLKRATEVNRTTAKNIFYNIDVIQDAIKRHKWISFKYKTYNDKGEETTRYSDKFRYYVRPYYLVNNFGKYYCLLIKYKFDTLSQFRLDYMIDTRVEENKELEPITSFEAYKDGFDLTKYLNEHIYLFGQEIIDATLEMTQPHDILYIKEWFGNKASITNENGKLYAHVKCDMLALKYWLLQYGERFKAIAPDKLVEDVKKSLEIICDKYK